MEKLQIFLDTDVLINWIAQEVNKNSCFKLWKCPYEILKLVESDEIIAYTAMTNVFEIRYVLRRKMKYSDDKIKNFLNDIFNNIKIEIPDSIDMLDANKLQDENPLDPFDAIGLSIVKAINSCILVSRDSDFIRLTENSNSNACVPEKFLQLYFPELFDKIKIELY